MESWLLSQSIHSASARFADPVAQRLSAIRLSGRTSKFSFFDPQPFFLVALDNIFVDRWSLIYSRWCFVLDQYNIRLNRIHTLYFPIQSIIHFPPNTLGAFLNRRALASHTALRQRCIIAACRPFPLGHSCTQIRSNRTPAAACLRPHPDLPHLWQQRPARPTQHPQQRQGELQATRENPKNSISMGSLGRQATHSSLP